MLAAFPQEIVLAAEKYDPSRINRFVIDLASAFHRFYGSCRIQEADPALQQARIALCIGGAQRHPQRADHVQDPGARQDGNIRRKTHIRPARLHTPAGRDLLRCVFTILTSIYQLYV